MTNLVTAYQNNDINDFEKILKVNRQTIMEDTFIREHIEDLLKNIRTQVCSLFISSTLSFYMGPKWRGGGDVIQVNNVQYTYIYDLTVIILTLFGFLSCDSNCITWEAKLVN